MGLNGVDVITMQVNTARNVGGGRTIKTCNTERLLALLRREITNCRYLVAPDVVQDLQYGFTFHAAFKISFAVSCKSETLAA